MSANLGLTHARAIHVCADIAAAGVDTRWPPMVGAADTARRMVRVCEFLGIEDQQILAGPQATRRALARALDEASTALAGDGLLVLTFSGHTRRGEGPIGTARWCLFDGGLELSQISSRLALLPRRSRLVVVSDTCYAEAIAHTLVGPQEAVVVASCGPDQSMVTRLTSEFIVRMESFLCSSRDPGSLADLRALLEDETPDCERPCIWTNAEDWWSARPIPVPQDRGVRLGSSSPPVPGI